MYMRLSLAILILFFTDATRAQECPSRHRPTIYSIRRFVTTSQRLWTYKVSKAGRIRCQYNQMRTASPFEIVYNRTFLCRRGRRSISLRGEFDVQHKNRMHVRSNDLQQIFLSRETLLYLGDRASCGVLKIETMGWARSGECGVTATALCTTDFIIPANVSTITAGAALSANKLPLAALRSMTKSLALEATHRVWDVRSDLKLHITSLKGIG
uniref:Lipocalin n=1 Tax=Rhipicephalus appendiculatus TaxID=34631 RepID=A0A131YQ47_RHIAP